LRCINNRTYNGFDMIHQVIEGDESKLSLQVSILTQVATRMTIGTVSVWITIIIEGTLPVLGTKTLLNTEDITKRWQTSL
jgi:hypothetical protein